MNDMARKGGAIRCSSQRVPGTVHYEEEVREWGATQLDCIDLKLFSNCYLTNK